MPPDRYPVQSHFSRTPGNPFRALTDEDLGLNVDRSGEIDVMHIQTVGNGRQHEHLIRYPPANFVTHGHTEKDIHIQREVMALLFG